MKPRGSGSVALAVPSGSELDGRFRHVWFDGAPPTGPSGCFLHSDWRMRLIFRVRTGEQNIQPPSFLLFLFALPHLIIIILTLINLQFEIKILHSSSLLFLILTSSFHPPRRHSYESAEEVLPASPRITSFPTVSGSPASLAASMETMATGSSPRHRRVLPTSM